jgi:uncharacterized protein (DUF2267 family)
MRYATFMTIVEQAAGITREEAERAVPAALQTLGERISGGEARDLAAFLPRALRPLLTAAPEAAESFDRDEFIRRVAAREGVDRDSAAEHVRAVFVALGAAAAPGELRDMAAQLPRNFDDLLEAAGIGRRQAMTDDDLVLRVAELAGWTDREPARRATEAVLETLAERISDGEVDDLMLELPGNLRPALARGLRASRAAQVMTADEFVASVADREGVDLEEAEQHVAIVFTALREAISPKEFSDLVAQLSRDYASLLAR